MNAPPAGGLYGLYPADDFKAWFACAFGLELPEPVERFMSAYPRGAGGSCGSIWGASDIVSYANANQLGEKGICLIGTTTNRGVFLLRARDGKVFVVDQEDYSKVDATFSNMDVCVALLALDT